MGDLAGLGQSCEFFFDSAAISLYVELLGQKYFSGVYVKLHKWLYETRRVQRLVTRCMSRRLTTQKRNMDWYGSQSMQQQAKVLPALQRLPSASDVPVQQAQHFLHLLPEPPS